MLLNQISSTIAKELNIKPRQVDATTELLDAGNTVPFIARYRKEVTGSLEDEQIRNISERLTYLRNFVKRQEEILAKIEEQGKLTDELKTAIEKTAKLQELEDIYLPYKQKKRTKAQQAREMGLDPLAARIMLQQDTKGTPLQFAMNYIDEEKGVTTAEEAITGALYIIAENISEDAKLRQNLREYLWKNASIVTTLDEEKEQTEEGQIYLMYKEYN